MKFDKSLWVSRRNWVGAGWIAAASFSLSPAAAYLRGQSIRVSASGGSPICGLAIAIWGDDRCSLTDQSSFFIGLRLALRRRELDLAPPPHPTAPLHCHSTRGDFLRLMQLELGMVFRDWRFLADGEVEFSTARRRINSVASCFS